MTQLIYNLSWKNKTLGTRARIKITLFEDNSVSEAQWLLLLTAIVEEPAAKEEDENPEEETRKNLAFLLEKVEGCSVGWYLLTL